MDKDRSIEDLLRRLERVKRLQNKDQWIARCPAHKDNTPSLGIAVKGDKIVLHCYAGCTIESILDALRLEKRDLFLSDWVPSDRKPQIVAVYDYVDAHGSVRYQSVRMEPGRDGKKKTFFQRQPDGAGGWINNLNGIKGRWPYRLQKIQTSSIEEWIWVVEGEKDVQRLEDYKLLATTSAGGAGKWPGHHSFCMYFRDRKVVIIADNDPPNNKGRRAGLEHAIDVARKLQDYAASIKLLTERELIGLPGDGGDISDWLNAGHTIDELKQIADEAPEWTDRTGQRGSGDKPTDDELRDRWLDKSPPMIFGRGDFYRYDKGLWKPVGVYLIKREVMAILEDAKSEGIEPSSSILSSVVELARARCAVSDDQFDGHSDYLVCGNGTLQISTRKLLPHSHSLYATTGVNFEYDPEAKAPTWEAYIDWLGEKIGIESVGFLQEFAGLCGTTDISYEIAVWLFGQMASGKSTFVEGITNVFVDRYCKLGLRDIERSQFALAQLPGKTLAVATEQPGEFIRSLDVINSIISGEAITYEKKFNDPITITPTAKLLWAMDQLPRIPSASSGIFRRVFIVNFGRSVPEDERDPLVKERIKHESKGILNWCLDGLARLKERGRFEIPERVKQSGQDFRESNDVVNAFILECCVLGYKLSISGGELYKAYKKWCEQNGHKPLSNTRIRDDYQRLGLEKYLSNGHARWRGIDLNDEWKDDQAPLGEGWKK